MLTYRDERVLVEGDVTDGGVSEQRGKEHQKGKQIHHGLYQRGALLVHVAKHCR